MSMFTSGVAGCDGITCNMAGPGMRSCLAALQRLRGSIKQDLSRGRLVVHYQIEGSEEIHTRWPSSYAAEIIGEPSRDRRRELLAEVPEKLRDWVEYLVRKHWEKNNGGKRQGQ